MSRLLSNPLNDVLNGINGTAGFLKGQRVNCHGISVKFSIGSYQKKKIDIDTSLVSKGQEVLTVLYNTYQVL